MIQRCIGSVETAALLQFLGQERGVAIIMWVRIHSSTGIHCQRKVISTIALTLLVSSSAYAVSIASPACHEAIK